jgi:tRNA(Ile)-lysidine synthase
MLGRFLEYISAERLFNENDNLLLGVSGGKDSMVMLNLFSQTGFNTAVAHCNFGLRGEESDDDQLFVENECDRLNIICHTKLFQTKEYALEKGISVQMAARELRYSWFEELCRKFDYSLVAIAHNKNDLVETFLLNLARGTGIKGLAGIKSKNGEIVRPLLFATREEIDTYAAVSMVPFRDDSSNRDVKYKRNRIRSRIIPEFENLSPSFIRSVAQTAGRLRDVDMIFSQAVDHHFTRICRKTQYGYYMDINQLMELQPLNAYLFEFLKKWKFPKELIPDIISSMAGPPGKQFYSPTHRLVKDREEFIISPLLQESAARYYIEEGVDELNEPVKLKIRVQVRDNAFKIPNSKTVACLDMDLLHFPLILRKWEKGDYFQPLGMSGLKKVSDYFTDNKFSLVDKENTWLIASGTKVAWIAGHRLDDRFKVTERTREILMIELLE